MYEFTRIPRSWVEDASLVNEIWVPGKWMRDVFASCGVPVSKMIVIREGVDVLRFDPTIRGRIELPFSAARNWERACNGPGSAANFNFVSNFKWEPRKGWDILFDAYFHEFTADDDVSLYVLTTAFRSGDTVSDFYRSVEAIGTRLAGERLPHFCIVTERLSENDLGDLYNSADAFVLPTRGEGWGLPTIQAMALGKPTISTAWGGQMEFMTQETSFLIELDGLEEIPTDSVYGYDIGKKWATPSVRHTAELMRYVTREREHAAAVGRRARAHIVAHFSEEAVAQLADRRLHEIRSWLKHVRQRSVKRL